MADICFGDVSKSVNILSYTKLFVISHFMIASAAQIGQEAITFFIDSFDAYFSKASFMRSFTVQPTHSFSTAFF
jgi:hypothetical protein